MIKVFYGDDRVNAKREIVSILGNDYETYDGETITPADLPSIFYGTSLFTPDRHILIRDLTTNKPVYDQLINYINTPHTIILLETKLDKRTVTYKELKNRIAFKEFRLPPDPNQNLIFNIYRTAKTDGKKAVQMLNPIKPTEDPIKFTGLLVSQALKDFQERQGIKERQVLKTLAKYDLQMKSTTIDAWLLVESFLLELGSLAQTQRNEATQKIGN